MKDRVDARAGAGDRSRFANVSGNALDPQFDESGVRSPAQDTHFVAARDELLDDVQPEKSAAAGDQYVAHWRSAHAASCSRLIFVLCRTSTGSDLR